MRQQVLKSGEDRWGAERLIALFGAGVLWEVAGRGLDFAFLPPLSEVLQAGWSLVREGLILGHLAASLGSLVSGFGLALVIGLPIGALMGRYRLFEHLLDPYLHAFLAAPTLIFLPVMFAFFGVGRGSQTALVFIYAVFIMIADTMAGVRSVDGRLVEMARAFGANERRLFWRVILPGAQPLILAGIRLGLARAVKGMVNAEMFIALIGLGALIRAFGSRFAAAEVLAVLFIVLIVAQMAQGLLRHIDRRVTSWAR
jgi:NitT/TauT family transport system permease protein